MPKNYLLTPGPTPIPEEVLKEESLPIIHHRTPQFQAIIKEVEAGLKEIFMTKNDVFIFASSGTGAMEAAVCNLLSAGDKAITIQGGKFGERWTELCKAYGIEAVIIDTKWGSAVSPKAVAEKLAQDKTIKAVFATLCETSTAVDTDIKALAEATKDTQSVLVVDAISALGAVELDTDNWGVDVVVCGSQKGLMIPPGLAFITLSPKAWAMVETSRLPKYYFDLKKSKKALDKIDTHFTPAISLMRALNKSIAIIKKEGLGNFIKSSKMHRKAVTAACQAMGLKLFAEESCASNAVTAVCVPEGINGEALVKTMRDEYGVTFAGGQSELKGKIFRIAHMGYITSEDIIKGISTLEEALEKMGYKFERGAGVKAAKKVIGK